MNKDHFMKANRHSGYLIIANLTKIFSIIYFFLEAGSPATDMTRGLKYS